MDLTKEAIQQIETTAVAAMRATPLPQQPDPRKLVFESQGKITSLDVAPPLRSHAVRTLADLIGYADRVAEDGKPEGGESIPRPVLWHGENAVVLVLDDADRRDRVTFHLTLSEPFATLTKLAAEPRPFDQAGFIRLLRNVLGADQATVNQFRRLEWVSGDTTQSQLDKANSRLGAQVTAQCNGTADLPDDLLVSVPVYREQGERDSVQVRLLLDYDVVNKRILCVPFEGEIENAMAIAQARIRERIAQELPDVPVYYGTP